MTSGKYDACDLSLNGAGGVTKRRKPQTSRDQQGIFLAGAPRRGNYVYNNGEYVAVKSTSEQEFDKFIEENPNATPLQVWQAATQFACS